MATSGQISLTYNAGEFITKALRKIGYIGMDETPETPDFEQAVTVLNMMCKSWQMEGPNLWTAQEGTAIPLISGQQTYTLSPRPRTVENMRLFSVAQNREMYPLTPWNKQDWDRFPSKTSPGNPLKYLITRGRTDTTVQFWPVPNATGALTVPYSYERVWEDVTESSDDLDIPQEFSETVLMNLSAKLIVDFRVPIRDHSKVIFAEAADLKAKAMKFDTQGSVRFVRA